MQGRSNTGRAIFLGVVLGLSAAIGTSLADGRSWSKIIDAPDRFRVLPQFGSVAVLDKETGLVWEKTPQTAARDWATAVVICADSGLGGRRGWRLPTIEELGSLAGAPTTVPGTSTDLPAGHPFQLDPEANAAGYWSATTMPPSPNFGTNVAFIQSFPDGGALGIQKTVVRPRAWCVRGGQGFEGQ